VHVIVGGAPTFSRGRWVSLGIAIGFFKIEPFLLISVSTQCRRKSSWISIARDQRPGDVVCLFVSLSDTIAIAGGKPGVNGIPPKEIIHVVLLALTTTASPSRIAALRWVDTVLRCAEPNAGATA
jgi:hypothetical protein